MNLTPAQRRFAAIPAHTVRTTFTGGGLAADLGLVLLRGVNLQIGLTKHIAAALADRRHVRSAANRPQTRFHTAACF